MIRRRLALVLVPLAAALLAGCASGTTDPSASAPAPDASSAPPEVTITVLAAASLTGSFTEIGRQFEADHRGVTVTFSFAGSSDLAQQILQGAPADVFAAASPATMGTVTDGDAAAEPVIFARNSLEIAVPPGNPGKVTGIADFADPDLDIALCAPEVPCGEAAQKVFSALGITAAPDTLEQDVKAVLSKVQLDEVDAGLVYTTDVQAAGDAVEGISFPEASKAVTDYPIAVVKASRHREIAQEFVDYVLGGGEKTLAAAGFGAP